MMMSDEAKNETSTCEQPETGAGNADGYYNRIRTQQCTRDLGTNT